MEIDRMSASLPPSAFPDSPNVTTIEVNPAGTVATPEVVSVNPVTEEDFNNTPVPTETNLDEVEDPPQVPNESVKTPKSQTEPEMTQETTPVVEETPPNDLDRLGDRLEKFVSGHAAQPHTPAPEAPPRKSLSPKERKNSAGSHIPKPEISPKPSFLSKGANLMTQSLMRGATGKSASAKPPVSAVVNSNNGTLDKSANSKLNGTANMLKSTLRRMTRLSINTAKPVLSSESVSSASNRSSPEDPHGPRKRTSPRSHISPSSSTTSVSRSKSFRDPPPPTYPQRNSALSSSLRRPRNKDRAEETNRFQRSGTGGTLDRGPASGRNTVHRSHSTTNRRFKDRDLNVKKSRGVQTVLTRDVVQDEDDEAAKVDQGCGPSTDLEFTLYMPAVLGNEVDHVETHVSEPTEPVDVRKNRQLTLDNMKLHRELEKLKTQAGESDHLKKELRSVRTKLEEEHKSRLKIETELDKHNEKVRLIVASMDTVEREFETRDENIHALERDLIDAKVVISKMDQDLETADEVIKSLRGDLSKSTKAQKTLLSQYQEADAESRELQEFLQAEKMTLAETLKDCESEIAALKSKVHSKDLEVAGVEERCSHLVRLSEQRQQEILALQAQLSGIQDKARDMLLAQGAEISRANVNISELQAQLERMLVANGQQPGSLTASTSSTNNKLTAQRSESVEDESMSLEELTLPRSQSQFLVSVPVSSGGNGIMTSSLVGAAATTGDAAPISESLQNLASAISKRQNSENGEKNEEESSMASMASNGSLPSLADRISDVQVLMERVLASQKTMQQR